MNDGSSITDKHFDELVIAYLDGDISSTDLSALHRAVLVDATDGLAGDLLAVEEDARSPRIVVGGKTESEPGARCEIELPCDMSWVLKFQRLITPA